MANPKPGLGWGIFPRFRLGFVPHLAPCPRGHAVRQRLFSFPSSRYAFAELLENSSTREAEKFSSHLASWSPTVRTPVFQAQSTQKTTKLNGVAILNPYHF